MSKKKIDLGDGYTIEGDEDSFYSDADKKREYFEESGSEKTDKEADYSDFDGDFDEDFDDFEYMDGDEAEDQENDNRSEYEKTTKTHQETFVMWWKIFDESRAALLSAWFKVDKEPLIFYPKIEEEGEHETIKKSGAILVRKYSNLIFFSHAPEMILLGAILISTGVLYFRAKSNAKEKPKQKTDKKKEGTTSKTTEEPRKKTQNQGYEAVKTG